MDIYRAVKLLIKYFWLLAGLPLLAGVLMFVMLRGQSREYVSRATIYTGITSGHSIENQGRDRVDYFATTVAFDNMVNILQSKNVLEEVGLRLFTQHILLKEAHPRFISVESFAELQDITPDEVRELVVPGDAEATYQRFVAYKDVDTRNFLYELINLKHRHYSVEALSRISARRVQGSDLLQVSYRADDPGVALQTLNILIEVFFNTHSELKMAQTSTVVEYFEKQMASAWAKLVEEENRLLEFNQANRIINYHEQTKYVASQKEQFELSVQQAQLEYGGANAVLERLETEIISRTDINLRTQRVMDLRNDLLEVNRQIERLSAFEDPEDGNQLIRDLEQVRHALQGELRNSIDSLFLLEKNIDGVERERILGQWFEHVLSLEQARARLGVLDGKRAEFDSLYMFYAPLGATINRIERAIGVHEREYLSILHNLGLAKLRQQNLELSANMDLLDRPFLPIQAEPGRTRLFMLIAMVFAFFFVLAGIFATELLDRRVKTVKRLANLTGLPVAGAILDGRKHRKIDVEALSRRSVQTLTSVLLQGRQEEGKGNPLVVQFLSHWHREGKSFCLQKIQEALAEDKYLVARLCVGAHQQDEDQDVRPVSHDLYRSLTGLKSLLDDPVAKDYAGYDFIFLELPAVSAVPPNAAFSRDVHFNILLVNAHRIWSSADKHHLEKLMSATGDRLHALLNQVTPDHIEEYIGDIPKKRSLLRRFIKNRLFKRYIGFYP